MPGFAADSVFGTVTVRTPFVYSAVIASSFTPSPMAMMRSKAPELRSRTYQPGSPPSSRAAARLPRMMSSRP